MSACLRHSLASLNACYVESGKEINAPLGVWIAGNFLSAAGGNRGVCEDLAERLGAFGWRVMATSRRTSRVARVTGILYTALSRRRDYEVT
jgi:hypothetical protein